MWRRIAPSVVRQQMELAPEPVMDGDDGAVDIADQAVAENHTWDLPIPPAAHLRQPVHLDDGSGFTSGLPAQRLVGEPGERGRGFSDRRQRIPFQTSIG